MKQFKKKNTVMRKKFEGENYCLQFDEREIFFLLS